MPYIAKCKVTIYTKKARSSHQNYVRDDYMKGYLYLDYDKGNNIRMMLRFGDGKKDHKIQLSKWAVFQMFLYHLALRPIYKTDTDLWVDENIETPQFHEDIDTIPAETIMSEYSEALRSLHRVIPRMSDKGQEMAKKQLEKLLERQLKIDVINQIEKSKNIKTDALPWDNS